MLEDPTELLLKTVKKTKQRTKVISAEHRAIHDHIDEIDALVLIDVLNKKYQNREYGFNKEVVVKSYAVDDTSGLRVYLQPNGIHTFKDFANKGRYGIYGFLYHYYFKIPENEEGINAEFIYKFLNEEFGVKKALTRRNYSYIGLNTFGNYVFDEFCYANSETIKWEDFQILLKIKEALKEASVYTLENERNTILIDKRELLESLTKNELSRAISIFPLIGRRQKTETSFEDISVKARKEIEILQNLLSSIDVNSTAPLVLTDEKKNMLLEKSQSIAKYLNRNNVQQASYGGILDISERDGYLLINVEKDTKYFEKNPKQKKFLPKKFLNFLTSTRSGKAFKALITLYWGLQSYGKYKVHFSEFGYKSKSSVYALIKRSGLVDSGFITLKLEKDYFYIGNKYNNISSRTNKERASK